jgi:hypothetical protein
MTSDAAGSMYADMPCCQQPASIAQSDPARMPQVDSTGSLNQPLQWDLTGWVNPVSDNFLRVFATLSAVRHGSSELSPPLFLTNAQFRI